MTVPDPERRFEMKEISGPYDVKTSVLNILFHPGVRLGGAELVRQYTLAQKIEAAGDDILLEEEEYQRLKKAFDSFEGFGRNDVEFVMRILEAEQLDMSKDKPE